MSADIRAIAFYLPQFHPIPENDAWWGAGFTEWRNVVRGRPNFAGHYQPRLPADLGFYDLRVPETRAQQAALARAHGIGAFCYYHYWFSGKRLLQRPFDEVLASGAPDFPFCICWANETWTRRWDGLDSDVLIEQRYRDGDALALLRDLLPAFADRRYVRIDGKPLLLVYCPDAIPEPQRWAQVWRSAARDAGHPDLYLALVQSVNQTTMDPAAIGYDAAVEFPPHLTRSQEISPDPGSVRNGFRGDVLDYVSCAQNALARPHPGYRLFRGVMTGWDNTARVPDIARCFVNAEPANYERWLAAAAAVTREWHGGDERILFVNAWNEWAEGCHLEPDLRYGRAFLEATRRALGGA